MRKSGSEIVRKGAFAEVFLRQCSQEKGIVRNLGSFAGFAVLQNAFGNVSSLKTREVFNQTVSLVFPSVALRDWNFIIRG